jgi:hypothetical protein
MMTGAILGITLLLVVTAEALLLAFWVPAYYRRGIRVARRVVPMSSPTVPIASLEAQCAAGVVSSRLAFRHLSDQEIGFQEAGVPITFWSPGIPVIRGLIIADPKHRRAEVVGVLLWYPVVALTFLLVGMASEGFWATAVVTTATAAAVFVMGSMQWARYNVVVRALSGPPAAQE